MVSSLSAALMALFRRAPQTTQMTHLAPSFTIETNPFRCKRPWPPEFTKLSQKHQFRLERRYRRRSKLKYARPTWTKGVKLAQWGSILFVVIYGVFFMEVDQPERFVETISNNPKYAAAGQTPFDGVRQRLYDAFMASNIAAANSILRFARPSESSWAFHPIEPLLPPPLAAMMTTAQCLDPEDGTPWKSYRQRSVWAVPSRPDMLHGLNVGDHNLPCLCLARVSAAV